MFFDDASNVAISIDQVLNEYERNQWESDMIILKDCFRNNNLLLDEERSNTVTSHNIKIGAIFIGVLLTFLIFARFFV